jgi:hypothetical protein
VPTAEIVPKVLEEQAAIANSEYELCTATAAAALDHAVRCGEALLRAKAEVPKGEWEEWVNDNFRAPRQARAYIRLATYKDRLPAAGLTINDALIWLRGLPSVDGTGLAHPPEVREEAMRLLASGMSGRMVAKALGLGRTTLGRWAREAEGTPTPSRGGTKRSRIEETRRVDRERRATLRDRRALADGRLAAAISLLRRAAAVLDSARDDAPPDAREELSAAADEAERLAAELAGERRAP